MTSIYILAFKDLGFSFKDLGFQEIIKQIKRIHFDTFDHTVSKFLSLTNPMNNLQLGVF